MKDKYSSIKEKAKTIDWAFKIAWKIDKNMLVLWFGLSISLSVLPAIALHYNREIISNISNFISTGFGRFTNCIFSIIILGLILTAIGLSKRINGDLLYMMMYDSYYLGMEEIMMDTIQKIDMITLLNKDMKDEYNAIINRAGSLTDFMSSFCILASKIVSIGSLLIVAFSVSKVIFFVSLIYVIIIIYINGTYTKKDRVNMMKIREEERLTSYIEGMPLCDGISKEMRLYGAKEDILKQWRRAYRKIEDNNKKKVFGLEIRSFISGVIFYIFMIGIIVYSIFRVQSSNMSADIFLMIYVLCQNMSNAISGVARSFIRSDYGLFALERQRKFINSFPDNYIEDENKITKHPQGKIVFEAKNINFCYNEDHLILKNINLKINKGEIIALVGRNGSGKTTLVKLLLGLYKPVSGKMLFYNKPYSEYKRGFINKSIGTFFQDFYLFHASLKENVGFGDLKNIDNENEIIKALNKGGASKILEKLPKGLNNWIGKDVDKDGALLSGGEKQKIAISRAHMSDKDILIFDEPAAALDPIAEMEQFMGIKEKVKERTAILISHRVGFARLADRIIVLNNGEIVEDGTHNELISKKGVYAHLYNKQAQWYDTAQASELKVVQ